MNQVVYLRNIGECKYLVSNLGLGVKILPYLRRYCKLRHKMDIDIKPIEPLL